MGKLLSHSKNAIPRAKLFRRNLVCDAGLAMHKDGKTTDNNRTRQKFCCPFRQSKTGVCPCNHKNWNNGKKNRGCVKYRIVPTDYRLSIDRSCLCFTRTYALMEVPICLYSPGFLSGLFFMRFFSFPSNPRFFSLFAFLI